MHIRILAGLVDGNAGSHVYHRELIRRLAERGHRVSVLCFDADGETRGVAEVYALPRSAWRNAKFLWRFASWLDHASLRRRVRRSALTAPDVVIGGEHLFLKAHRHRFPRTPLVYFPHAPFVSHEIANYRLTPTSRWLTTRLYRRLQRWALRHAERTVRFTRQGCELLEREYPRARPSFVINPVGVELPALRERNETSRVAELARVRAGCGDDPEFLANSATSMIRLLSVGRLVSWKGIDTALRALAPLRDLNWRLDIVGEGECRGALEKLATELGLGDRVHFHGFQAELAPWYRQADLFLFPSRCEGLGLVALDAMSHGVPCLAIRPDGVRYVNVNNEIIDHSRDGLLAAGEDDFRLQLEKALRYPEQLKSLGEAARAKVAERFSWTRHLDRYEALFEELIHAGRG